MPVSKKPRKKGNRPRVRNAMRRIKNGNYKDETELLKLVDIVKQDDIRIRNGSDQLEWMLSLQQADSLTDAFTKSTLAIDRWPTTMDLDDFNIVSSSLMLGAMVHVALRVQEKELLTEIQDAAFRSVVCVRLRQKGEALPTANLAIVYDGLRTAQDLVEYACEHDRQTLIRVLKENTPRYVHAHPEVAAKHEALILGRHLETVQRWEEEDELNNVGVPPLKEPPHAGEQID